MSSIKKNLGYQTIYQILSTCLPLITSPYLSRVLGAESLGIFSYTQSIVGYFTLIAMLGMANYGTRSIAQVSSGSKSRLSKEFWSIFSLQFITSAIAVTAYSIYLVFICKQNELIAAIQIIAVISCLLDINWFYFGIEKFEITVKRNIVIRIVTLISILLFVKSSNDLWIYTFIMVASTFLSEMVLWLYMPKYVNLVKFTSKDVIRHIRPNITLFIPLAAMSVYHIMDKTMLGIFSTFEETGYYYNSDKIINIPAGIVAGISTVLMPRITALISEGKHKEMEQLFAKSLEGTIFIASPLALGIAAISNEFVPLFFGDGYDSCILLTIVLSPVLIIKGLSYTFRYLYLIPYKMDSKYIFSVVLGMISNLIANMILIPRYGAMGAVIGTLIAEIIACAVQILSVTQKVDLKKSFSRCILSIFLSIVMFILVRATVNSFDAENYIKIACGIITGILVYVIFALLLIKKILNKKEQDDIFKMIKIRI